MAAEIVMPRLSDSMEEGTILTWMKAPGDEVERGDELVEIETDKANMVYESDSSGTLVEILATEGATLPIGQTIARLGGPDDEVVTATPAAAPASSPGGTDEGGDAASSPAGGPPHAPAAVGPGDAGAAAPGIPPAPPVQSVVAAGEAPAAPADLPAAGVAPTVKTSGGRVIASPIARRIARESGIDLASLNGSGPGGRIVKADVEGAQAAGVAAEPSVPSPTPPPGGVPSAATGAPLVAAGAGVAATQGAGAPASPTPGATERPETAKGRAEVVELSKLQQTVARRMAESKATAPHFYLTTTIDMSRAVAARAQIKSGAAAGEVVPSFNDLVVKACALALREFPRANGAYRDGRIELYSRVNVGVAVAGQGALMVPTVFDTDLKGLRQIAAETRALATRVRDGSITPPELSGGTFTVSNLGMYGVTSFAAVINPPQAAILAVGEIAERPVASGGEISTAQLMDVTLASDHRILYGADGAEFLARIRALLEEPLVLAL